MTLNTVQIQLLYKQRSADQGKTYMGVMGEDKGIGTDLLAYYGFFLTWLPPGSGMLGASSPSSIRHSRRSEKPLLKK